MIIIGRWKGDCTVIRQNIFLTVAEIRADEVDLGIKRPEGTTVVTCRMMQRLAIEDAIFVTLTQIKCGGRRVKLGIEAPSSVSIHRMEVHDAIHRGLEQAE